MSILDQLVEFAKEQHGAFSLLGDEQSRALFEKYKRTTKVRIDEAGNITGFAVWDEQPDKIMFIAIAGVGERKENYREMMKYLRQFKKPVWIDSKKVKK